MQKIIASVGVCVALLFVASPEVFAAEPAPLPGDEPGTAVVAPAAAPASGGLGIVNSAKPQPEPKHAKASKTLKKGGRSESLVKKTNRTAANKSKPVATKGGKSATKSHPPAAKSKKHR